MKTLTILMAASLTWPVLAVENDADLPQAFDPNTLGTLLTASPFNRAINPSDTLVLTGLAYVNGKPIAHLLDTETKKTHVLTDKPNSTGWTLVDALPARNFTQAQVKVQIGGETVTIRSNAAAVSESRKSGSGGAPPPPSGDRGRGPSEGDRGFSRSNRGPSREDIDKFSSLSPESQEKMKSFFRDNRDKFMNMSEDDRRNFIKSNFEKVYNEDQQRRSGGGGGPSPR
jgi:hypothetical protein